MATDATGTPSANFSFPKLNTSVDAPSGLGINAMVDDIDSKLNTQFVHSTDSKSTNEVPVWNGSAWVYQKVAPANIDSTGATNGQVIRYNGTSVEWGTGAGVTSATHEVDTEQSISLTNTWENLATDGPEVTIPSTGTYLILAEAEAINATGNFDPNIGIVVGDNTPAASDIRDSFWPTANARFALVLFTVMSLTLNDNLKLRYRDRSRNDTTFRSRKLAVILLP